eukprot:s4535_g6.t1
MSDDDGLHHGGAPGPCGAPLGLHPSGVQGPGRAPGDAGAGAPAGAQSHEAGQAASSAAGPQPAAPMIRPDDGGPAAEPEPPRQVLFTTSCGTVYHERASCGKLKCARRIYRHEGCPTCPRWSRGIHVGITTDGVYHTGGHAVTTSWRPCSECSGG